MTYQRQEPYRRNEDLEHLLEEINGLLSPVEKNVLEKYKQPEYPVIFVVGNPRCGKTLVMQWLAAIGEFCYPTNLLARFYGAPYIGAKIQLLLSDERYSFRDETHEFSQSLSFTSDIGKTAGALSPNEFYYFWKRFFPYEDTHYLTAEERKKVDLQGFTAELAAIEAAFGKPFALKGDIANQNLSLLSGALDKVLFLYIKRDPFYNIQSILQTRLKHGGSREVWWSFKPREYRALVDLEPIEQVAGQVFFISQSVEHELRKMDPVYSLQVEYEDFCIAPDVVYDQIKDKLAQQGYQIEKSYEGPVSFESANEIRLSEEDVEKIRESYSRFSGAESTL
jgi:hypothetical protein